MNPAVLVVDDTGDMSPPLVNQDGTPLCQIGQSYEVFFMVGNTLAEQRKLHISQEDKNELRLSTMVAAYNLIEAEEEMMA